jgi:hypothetical protein
VRHFLAGCQSSSNPGAGARIPLSRIMKNWDFLT